MDRTQRTVIVADMTSAGDGYRQISISRSGETLLDGAAIVADDPFAAAIRCAKKSATPAAPVLIRVVEEDIGEVSWLEVDTSGAVTVARTSKVPQSAAQESAAHPGATAVQPDLTSRAEEMSSRARTRILSRPVLVGVACALGVALLAGAVWAGVTWSTQATAAPSTNVEPAAPSVVTLPGFAREAAWSVEDVTAAAANAGRVLEVSGSVASVRDVASGDVIAATPLEGATFSALAGSAEGLSALAAVSESRALVWVGDAIEPVFIDLSDSQRFTSRSGVLLVAGADRSFFLVTATGLVPVTAPRPEMIVLGVTDGQVLWAGAPHQVIVASPNGTALREITLTAPVEGAVITPKVGWVRVATTATVVVGWTLPDGSTTTGVHTAATGELVAQIPGAGDGVLSPDARLWVVNGSVVDLPASTVAALPDGFTASRFLGADLYGALADGKNAICPLDGSKAQSVPTATVQSFAIADDTLLTFTGARLAGYPTAH